MVIEFINDLFTHLLTRKRAQTLIKPTPCTQNKDVDGKTEFKEFVREFLQQIR